MMRTPGLWKLAEKYGLKFITIRELQDYCRIHEKHVVRKPARTCPPVTAISGSTDISTTLRENTT